MIKGWRIKGIIRRGKWGISVLCVQSGVHGFVQISSSICLVKEVKLLFTTQCTCKSWLYRTKMSWWCRKQFSLLWHLPFFLQLPNTFTDAIRKKRCNVFILSYITVVLSLIFLLKLLGVTLLPLVDHIPFLSFDLLLQDFGCLLHFIHWCIDSLAIWSYNLTRRLLFWSRLSQQIGFNLRRKTFLRLVTNFPDRINLLFLLGLIEQVWVNLRWKSFLLW